MKLFVSRLKRWIPWIAIGCVVYILIGLRVMDWEDLTSYGYRSASVPLGEVVPGTTMRFTGVKLVNDSSSGLSLLSPQFQDTITGDHVDFGPFISGKFLQGDTKIITVDVDTVGPPRDLKVASARLRYAVRRSFAARLLNWPRWFVPFWPRWFAGW